MTKGKEQLNPEAETALRIMSQLKKIADEYPHDSDNMPHERHWATLPGNVRVCFTRKYLENKWKYHLSVSAYWGRVHDIIVMAILKTVDAPKDIETIEISSHVRHFMWPVTSKGIKH